MIDRRQLLGSLLSASVLAPLGASLGRPPHALAAASSVPAPVPAPDSVRHILLDTDIGSDIDDAVALAWLLRQPRCNLLGITTVTGEAHGRARLASALCRAAGRSVPIHPGAEVPLVIESMQKTAPALARLRGPEERFASGEAIEFMRRTIRAHPHQVTLLAVGPLTNVALLFRADPEIPALLRELVIMGGKYSDYPTPWGPTEWNAIVDPHAAQIVFASDVPALTAFGLDVTWQVGMTPEEVTRHFRGASADGPDPLLEIVLDWSEVWFAERDMLHFNDPLAAAAIFEPGLCTYKHGRIAVDLGDSPTRGVTSFTADAASPQRFAATVRPAAFFDAYLGVFRVGRT